MFCCLSFKNLEQYIRNFAKITTLDEREKDVINFNTIRKTNSNSIKEVPTDWENIDSFDLLQIQKN